MTFDQDIQFDREGSGNCVREEQLMKGLLCDKVDLLQVSLATKTGEVLAFSRFCHERDLLQVQ